MDDKQLKEISADVERNAVPVPTSAERTIRRQYEKIERNSICPCEENMALEEGGAYSKGKRKKYKKCCWKKIQAKEQKTYELIHESKRIAEAKRNVAASIQHSIDHPIILPDSKIIAPGTKSREVIIP